MIYLMALIPVKIKMDGLDQRLLLVLGFLGNGSDYRLAFARGLPPNYFIFFGQEIFQDAVHRRDVHSRRTRFEAPAARTMKRCITAPRVAAPRSRRPTWNFRVARDGQNIAWSTCQATPPAA